MRAVLCDGAGGPEVLTIGTCPKPLPGPGQLLVRVKACALNRADLLQRMGRYPPPPGEPEILGLELAGDVELTGEGVEIFTPGDKVFGLVGGGAYAEFALLDARMAVPMPNGWSYLDATAVPEVFFTAAETLFTVGGLAAGETVLIHAGGSGVGTAAIQLAQFRGARAFVTAGSDEKIQRCVELGAAAGINYKTENFADRVQTLTDGGGVDLIEDFIGAENLERNLACLRPRGRLVLIAMMGGAKAELDLGIILRKRLRVAGFVLRPQSLPEKRAITERFQQHWLPALTSGDLRPVIDRTYPIAEVAAAHEWMGQNRNFGKILLDAGIW